MSDLLGNELDANQGRVLVTWEDQGDGTFSKRIVTRNKVWNPISLAWDRETQAGGTGSGGAVTVADGADVAEGTTTDAVSANTVVGLLKNIKAALAGTLTTVISGSVAVTGTFWQATQPISVASLPLPTGASTEATLALIKAKTDNLDVLLSTRTKPADTQPVSGTFWQATQPVSGTVTVSNPTTNPETGLAKDATIQAAIGLPTGTLTDPMVGTELDQLNRLHKDVLAEQVILRQILAALTPPIKKAAVPASILHGR